MEQEGPIELELAGKKIRISRHQVGKDTVYRVIFPDNRKPLVIHKAVNAGLAPFWTSIPEGRLAEAELIGKLLEEYSRKKDN